MTKREIIEVISEEEDLLWKRLKVTENVLGVDDPATVKARARWYGVFMLMVKLGFKSL